MIINNFYGGNIHFHFGFNVQKNGSAESDSVNSTEFVKPENVGKQNQETPHKRLDNQKDKEYLLADGYARDYIHYIMRKAEVASEEPIEVVVKEYVEHPQPIEIAVESDNPEFKPLKVPHLSSVARDVK